MSPHRTSTLTSFTLTSSRPRPTSPRAGPRAAVGGLVLATVLLLVAPGSVAAGAPRGATGTQTVAPERYTLPLETGVDAPARAGLVAAGLLMRDFAPPSVRWGAGHRGVDILAAPEATVRAPHEGTVAFVGVVVDRPLVVVTHPDGLRSTLEPVIGELTVGDRVARGEPLGRIAPGSATHCAPATCLHWGVRRGETYVDPLALVGRLEAVVLLPLAAS